MQRRFAILAVLSLTLMAPVVGADVLWDQSDFDAAAPGFFNSDSGSPPFGLTWHGVNDVTVEGSGWEVQSISVYFSALDPFFGDAISQAYVHVFDKTGPLPDAGDDPTASPLEVASAVLNGDHFVVTVAGLSINLAPGEYWIGITPVAPSGPFGPEIHLSASTLIGDATASYDVFGFPTPMWFNFNPGVDASILIEGEAFGSTPLQEATWGEVKSLYRD